MPRRGIDFAAGRPGAVAIKAAGFDFVVRYLTPGGAALPGKQLLGYEYADYLQNDISVCFMWETTADRALSGSVGGLADSVAATQYLKQLGVPDSRPVYYAVDFDAAPAQQPTIDRYFAAITNAIGAHRVGLYGDFYVLGRTVAAFREQTIAWSGGNFIYSSNLFQTGEQVYINGIQCDVIEAMTPDFGQWPLGGLTMELTDRVPNPYHDTHPDASPDLSVADCLGWAPTHAALCREELAQLRKDLPALILTAIGDSTVHVDVTVETK
ncbi:MAG: glycoside hydrolase domain-containing protein [Candidatus Dormibacteria bacterium]